MDLDPPIDQILDSRIPWDSSGVYNNTTFEFESHPVDSTRSPGPLSDQHATTGWNCIVILESSMDIDMDFNFDFNLDVPMTPAQVNDLNKPQDPKLPSPSDEHLDKAKGDGIGPNNTRPRLDQTQLNTLNEWVADCAIPYPTKKEKLSLAERTGLTISQISSWFSRFRQKKLKGTHPKSLRTVNPPTSLPLGEIWPSSLHSYERSLGASQSSLPIASTKSTALGAVVRRSQSLPSYFTLVHL